MFVSVDSPFFAPSLYLMVAGTLAVAATVSTLTWVVPQKMR